MRRSGGEDCDCDGDEVDDVSVPSRGDWQGVILAEAAGGDETTRASELGN